MTIDRPGDQLPVEYVPPAAPSGADGDDEQRGPVETRDSRPIALAIGSGLALIVAALLVVALVRILADNDEAADTGIGPTGALAALVPNLAASPAMLAPEQQAGQLAQLLAEGRHDVATAAPTPMLCAAVALDSPLQLAGRWERNGQEVAATQLSQVGPPGFGDCVDDGGTPLDEGAYQFVLVDAEGHESAPGTIVIGADVVGQQVINAGSAPICALRLAPSRAGYFDAYEMSARPIAPGQSMTLAVAATEHELRATRCGDEGATDSYEFQPDPVMPLTLGPG